VNDLVRHRVEVPDLHEDPRSWWPGTHVIPRHLAELNDKIWGPANWVQCSCTIGSDGHAAFHHKDAHR
jgi:hypothetical protein